MLFNEIHSLYYKTVGKIITKAIAGPVTDKEIRRTIEENAFSESELTIFPAIKQQQWQLIGPDGTTPLKTNPPLPLTDLEKRWLKAISLDKRIKLFSVDFGIEDDVQPLFTPETVKYFDQYTDGDDYDSPQYQRHFRTVLKAINEGHHPLQVYLRSGRGNTVKMNVIPRKLEYSRKDDKFRLITSGSAYGAVINIGRIVSCQYYYGNQIGRWEDLPEEKRQFTMELTDERNALERVMLHFAHFEKQAEQLGEGRYRITIWYSQEDETEIIIRVLSFGPMVRVVRPDILVDRIKQRINRQMRYIK